MLLQAKLDPAHAGNLIGTSDRERTLLQKGTNADVETIGH